MIPKPTLREQLSCYKPETLVKIGCKDGNGFFFVGTVGEWEYFDQTGFIKDIRADFEQAVEVWRSGPDVKEFQDRLLTAFRKILKWRLFDDRTVESVDNSFIDDRKIIIVSGEDNGQFDGVDLPPLEEVDVNVDTAVDLINAIYVDGAKELIKRYKEKKNEPKQTKKSNQKGVVETRRTLENFFKENRFGLIDGKIVIDECRKRARE